MGESEDPETAPTNSLEPSGKNYKRDGFWVPGTGAFGLPPGKVAAADIFRYLNSLKEMAFLR